MISMGIRCRLMGPSIPQPRHHPLPLSTLSPSNTRRRTRCRITRNIIRGRLLSKDKPRHRHRRGMIIPASSSSTRCTRSHSSHRVGMGVIMTRHHPRRLSPNPLNSSIAPTGRVSAGGTGLRHREVVLRRCRLLPGMRVHLPAGEVGTEEVGSMVTIAGLRLRLHRGPRILTRRRRRRCSHRQQVPPA